MWKWILNWYLGPDIREDDKTWSPTIDGKLMFRLNPDTRSYEHRPATRRERKAWNMRMRAQRESYDA